jgi:hypothetical protein
MVSFMLMELQIFRSKKRTPWLPKRDLTRCNYQQKFLLIQKLLIKKIYLSTITIILLLFFLIIFFPLRQVQLWQIKLSGKLWLRLWDCILWSVKTGGETSSLQDRTFAIVLIIIMTSEMNWSFRTPWDRLTKRVLLSCPKCKIQHCPVSSSLLLPDGASHNYPSSQEHQNPGVGGVWGGHGLVPTPGHQAFVIRWPKKGKVFWLFLLLFIM